MALTIYKSKVEPVWASVDADEDSEDITEFKFVPLRGSKLDEVMHGMNPANGMLTPAGMVAALRYSIKDWRNLKDENGNDVKFSVGDFEKFSFVTRVNLCSKVIELSQVSDDDLKNS